MAVTSMDERAVGPLTGANISTGSLVAALVEASLHGIKAKGGHTDKKENKIFLKYREIQMGSGAKSYMRKGFLIYADLHKYFHHI